MRSSFNEAIMKAERESLQFQALAFLAEKYRDTEDGERALEKIRKLAGLRVV